MSGRSTLPLHPIYSSSKSVSKMKTRHVPILPQIVPDSPQDTPLEAPEHAKNLLQSAARMDLGAPVQSVTLIREVDRAKRSRERNRIHARKTRQRKKEQMLNLQERAEELKQEQLALKQIINEKNTASILVGLFATSANQNKPGESSEDPRVEALLRRPAEEIPDATKIPELPALILPGQHASRKARAEAKNCALKESEFPSDGIDYELLGRDRSKCTPEELDRIRRERNRMHAKRTRDRKRLFMEEMGEMCRQLEEENDLLLKHLKSIDPDFDDSKLPKRRAPEPTPEGPTLLSPKFVTKHHRASPTSSVSSHPSLVPSRFMQGNQLKALLDVAGSFGRTDNGQHVSTLLSVATAITGASDSDSSSLSSGDMDRRPAKRVKSH